MLVLIDYLGMTRPALFFIVVLLAMLVPLSAGAQDKPYVPFPVPPLPDPMHFPTGSDLQTFQESLESLENFEENKNIGQGVASQFGGPRERFDDHPWKGGRDLGESLTDWFTDSSNAVGLPFLGDLSMEDFLECFEPRLVFPTCPFCWPPSLRPNYCSSKRNLGYIWEYWWPEWEVETNNFGIAAFNPIVEGRVDLLHPMVGQLLESIFRPVAESYIEGKFTGGVTAEIPDELREEPHLGNAHFAGLLPGDQTLVQEAHVYRSMVAQVTSASRCKGCGFWDIRWKKLKFICVPIPFWYNGWRRGNDECFYDTLPPERGIVAGWTEQPGWNFYWRIPEFSAVLGDRSPELYAASVPLSLADTTYWQTRSCGSYRISKWPDIYQDLTTAAGMIGMSSGPLRDICYKGGGQLYPVTGTMMGHFHPLTSAAYFSRRAIELSSELLRDEKFSGDFPFNWVDIYTGVPYFADRNRSGDSIDKLQRVFPEPSKCFKIQQIMDRNRNLFPPDAERPEGMGSTRYLYWNKRIACTCEYRGTVTAAEKFRLFGWGCQRFPTDWMPGEELSRGHFFDGFVTGLIPPPPAPLWPPWAESASPAYTWPYLQSAFGAVGGAFGGF